MNDNARKWIEALRSGEYKQAQEFLRTNDGYCCLGVACELYMQEHHNLNLSKNDADNYYYYNKDSLVLPPIVQEWLGLRYCNGTHISPTGSIIQSLADLNDDGEPFSVIADVIESEPKELFI